MKCICDELIQKYIDNEASKEEVTYVETHLISCDACKDAVDEQKKLAAEIRNVINLLSEETIEIPTFERKNKRVILRWSLFAASVACILAFILFTHKPEKDTPIDSTKFFHNTENEFDANRSISQQDMVLKIVDSEGNMSEYNL